MSEENLPLIRVVDVEKRYRLEKTESPALSGVSVDIHQGERVALMGPSGSGKSTLLNLIGCLDRADAGQIIVSGQPTTSLKDRQLSVFRNRTMGFIFQSFNLIPVLSVFENVEYPLLLQTLRQKERRERVLELLDEVGLADFASRTPENLSGGQRQRVAIARALVTRPRLVLADEPTAALDQKTGHVVMELMARLNEVHGSTLVFSTHDHGVAAYARRIVHLVDGKIVDSERGGAA